jgi:hypothetical protein
MNESNKKLTEILARHLYPSLEMINQVVSNCPEGLWCADRGTAPIWLHLYHALVGIDFWFRLSKSQKFEYLTFGKTVDPDIQKKSADTLSKDEIKRCVERAKEKAAAFILAIRDEGLSSKCPLTDVFTKADILLMQIRHLQHHIGFCNGLLSSNGAQAAKWVGYGE